MNKVIVGFLVAAFVIMSGCSSEKAEPNPAASAAAPVQEDQAEATQVESVPADTAKEADSDIQALSVGSAATLGDWDFTLKKMEVQDEVKSDYSRYVPEEGMKYIVLDFDIENKGAVESTFVDVQDKATLFYQDKYEYERADLVLDGSLSAYGVKPLEETSGFLVFPVPEKVAADKTATFNVVIEKNGEKVKYELQ